jgi:hypothetical protein
MRRRVSGGIAAALSRSTIETVAMETSHSRAMSANVMRLVIGNSAPEPSLH